MTPMKTHKAMPIHHEFNAAMKDVLAQFKEKLTAMEMLAVASQLVGGLVAIQDQRVITPDMAMEVIARNIEAGNAEAMSLLMNPVGNA